MKEVMIIQGTYGYQPEGSKKVIPKSKQDGSFELSDEEAERLVNLGVAAMVDSTNIASAIETLGAAGYAEDNGSNKEPPMPVATGAESEYGSGAGVNTPEGNNVTEGDNGVQDIIPAYSVDMKPEDLRELMKAHNLPLRRGMSKADMVADLNKCFGVIEDGDEDDADDGESPPELTPEEPLT